MLLADKLEVYVQRSSVVRNEEMMFMSFQICGLTADEIFEFAHPWLMRITDD